MKTAQEFRAGQVANIDGSPWVIQKAEFNKTRPQRCGCEDEIEKLA